VGGVRTLLFNYLFARKHGGTLVLRIEDTDQARSTPEHERMLLGDVVALGIEADESPGKGGPHAPYRQSERLPIYGRYVQQLLDSDRAYPCFCPAELIAEKREAALKLGRTPVYDGTCARLPKEEVARRTQAGEKAGIRFRAPNRSYLLEDAVRGQVEFKAGTVGDFLITRSPQPHEKEIGTGIGMPVYNFCCVIDDALMGMTHVIRGEDHLSNTARQLMLYEAFGFALPVFAHTAMVLGSDRQKLSKRNGDSAARDYLEQGYLKEALLNFLTFLGWNPKLEQKEALKPRSGHAEILFMDELVAAFDLSGLQKAPAVFDLDKLKWMNAQYMKLLPAETMAARARPFFEKCGIAEVEAGVRSVSQEWFIKMVDLLRVDHGLLSELPAASRVFFNDEPALSGEARKAVVEGGSLPVVQALRSAIEGAAEPITPEAFESIQKKIGADLQVKGKSLFIPIRVALTGEVHGPEMRKAVPLLGKTRALKRIQSVEKQLHGH
jgi:nondiscriminating glutamyl-tRNA synthetase